MGIRGERRSQGSVEILVAKNGNHPQYREYVAGRNHALQISELPCLDGQRKSPNPGWMTMSYIYKLCAMLMKKWTIVLLIGLISCGQRTDSDLSKTTENFDSTDHDRQPRRSTMTLSEDDHQILDDFRKRRSFFADKLMHEKMPRRFFTCPSCGFPTLNEKGGYEICTICDWEDDGQDDANADKNLGGPNKISLTESRLQIGRELKFLADSLHGHIVSDPDQFFDILSQHEKRMKLADDKIKDDTDANDPAWENRRRTRELVKIELIKK